MWPGAVALLLAAGVAAGVADDESATCEPMKSDMCRSSSEDQLPFYNMTGMPNLANLKSQADANFELATYFPLIKTGCAKELQFFLCSVYVPMCVAHSPQKLIGPCRALCERVKLKCERVLSATFQHEWPAVLNCEKFPRTNVHEHMCIDVPPGDGHFSLGLPPSSLNTLQTNQLFMEKVKEQLAASGDKTDTDKFKSYKNYMQLLENNFAKIPPAQGVNVHCGHLKKSPRYFFVERDEKCVPECGAEISYSFEDRATTNSLVLSLSVLCFAMSTATFVVAVANTWAVDNTQSATNFAAHTAKFLALAYIGHSFGYIVSQAGLRYNCADEGKCTPWMCIEEDGQLVLAQEGHRNLPCVVVFLFVYFFNGAASAWWTVLGAAWCLAYWWTAERARHTLARVCVAAHAFGWGVPAILTLAALIGHYIEADELTSTCYPGALQNDTALLAFVLVPEGFQLSLGALLYAAGLCSAYFCAEPTSSAAKAKSAASALRALRTRVSCFGFVYLLAKVCVYGTWVYEYLYRRHWLTVGHKVMADPTLLWVRVSMSLLIGIMLPWWIATKETLACCKSLGCPALWSQKEKQQTTFPGVSYRPQATDDGQVNIGQCAISANRRDYI